MDTDFIYLLCLGLCLCYGDEDEHEELPRPSISAWPSSVVKCKSNVTLRCRTHFQNVTVTLGRLHNSQYQLQTSSLGKEAEFHLTNLQLEDAGGYFCTYRTAFSHSWSGQSRHLQLAVTGLGWRLQEAIKMPSSLSGDWEVGAECEEWRSVRGLQTGCR
ncbi:V-set and transmembrane domain-containing protein 1-like isoform X3 [Apodemus sylvaticus]|uniref:V-set and transmembrane domain-containing protein 1-like isoform X3 n=1 Tax=Apodemus sylvaticus TaxID=10129 RepID=UPI0022419C8C|nr:V-set and transmembrane domain-containing protein 1-like isoform X3 [Apodemus sylvaticus]